MLKTRVRATVGAGLAISLVAASLLTCIQVTDQLLVSLVPRFGEPAPISYRVPHGAVGRHHASTPFADAYRIFVPRGTLLSLDDPAHVATVAHEAARRPPPPLSLLGTWAMFFTFSIALCSYLRRLAQQRLRLLRTQVGLLAQIVGLLLCVKLLLLFTGLSEFWVPVATVPLWVAASFDRRTAIVVTVVVAFIVASLASFDLFVLSVALAQGLAAILLLVDNKRDRALLIAGISGGLSAAVVVVALMFVMDGQFDVVNDLRGVLGSRLLGCVGGGVLAGVLASLLRPTAQRLMGQVPRERLHDLTDLEQPLLKRMAERAPGSWEHARAMANLAEQAAAAIGADALLVRVGAYYHDLGKSVRPKFFVENLAPDEKSPHDDMDPDASADAILAHVVEGAQILRTGGIPEPVVEFAYTHHGTQLVEYFWNKCQVQGNPKGLSEEYFRYPGMRPQTKETAILMLVDSIEAASRTIDPPQREQFQIMIQRVVFTKLGSGQLDESGLTMRDLSTIIIRMTDTLVNMRHNRIKYPWQAEKAEQFGVPSLAVSLPPPPHPDEKEPPPTSARLPSLPPRSERGASR